MVVRKIRFFSWVVDAPGILVVLKYYGSYLLNLKRMGLLVVAYHAILDDGATR
jgi:hypothetical protein